MESEIPCIKRRKDTKNREKAPVSGKVLHLSRGWSRPVASARGARNYGDETLKNSKSTVKILRNHWGGAKQGDQSGVL